MRRYIYLYLVLMAICAGCKPADAPKLDPEPEKQVTADQKPDALTAPSDILMLSPSAQDGAQLYAGWPMVLELALWRQLPEGAQSSAPQPITIKAKSGSWSEALAVTVKGPSGNVVKWPLHPVKQDGVALTLGIDDAAGAAWWLSPEETTELAEGTYAISVCFDPKLVTGSLAQKSDNYYLSVKKEPVPLDNKSREDKDLSLASFNILKGDLSEARAVVSKVLASDPESIGGHRLNARLLDASGKLQEAASALDTALDIYYKKYPDACPPGGLLAERDALRAKIKPVKVPDRK
jgi:hypothetical protein